MSKHSPGPWRVTMQGEYIDDAKGNGLAKLYPSVKTHTRDANARLIAAAPEMLELLEKLACHDTVAASVFDRAKALIKRIEEG